MAGVQGQPLNTLNSERMLQKINQGKRRTHRIDVDFRELNEDFIGTIVVHHPSQMDRLKAGVLKSHLLGGIEAVDTLTDNIASIISTLDVVIDSKPDWFDVYDDILEYEVMEKVYVEYLTWVNSFRNRAKADAPKGDSEEQSS